MNKEKYESPEIQVISMEPDESIMDGEGVPGTSMGSGQMSGQQ